MLRRAGSELIIESTLTAETVLNMTLEIAPRLAACEEPTGLAHSHRHGPVVRFVPLCSPSIGNSIVIINVEKQGPQNTRPILPLITGTVIGSASDVGFCL